MAGRSYLCILAVGILLFSPMFQACQMNPPTSSNESDEGKPVGIDDQQDMGRLPENPIPAVFIENKGQFSVPDVRFLAEMGEMTVGLRDDALIVSLHLDAMDDSDVVGEYTIVSMLSELEDQNSLVGYSFSIVFDDCNQVRPTGIGTDGTTRNYLIGNIPSEWVIGVHGYNEVRYDDLWDGIALRLYSLDGNLKYDLELDEGTDPRQISFTYEGATSVEIDRGSGELIVSTPAGEIRDLRPVVFQDGLPDGRVGSEFVKYDEYRIGFSLPQECSKDKRLVIDPGLVFSTYFGGNANDEIESLAIDSNGNILVAGTSYSTDIPTTPGAFCATVGRGFIEKFDTTGSNLLYATYFGGTSYGTDVGSVTVMEDGRIVVIGETQAYDFPTSEGAHQRKKSGLADAFILVLDSSGSSLSYGSYFGGSGNETGDIHIIDSQGGLVLVGTTDSKDLRTTSGVYCATFNGQGGTDIYLVRFDSTFTNILRCTYLGGSGSEEATDIDLMDDMSLALSGITFSADFPVSDGAYCTTFAGGGFGDSIALKLNANWSSLEFSTYLGGGDRDESVIVRVLSNGTVLTSGYTRSRNFPVTPGALHQSNVGQDDAFVTLVNKDGSSLLYSTYWGGKGSDVLFCGAYDPNSSVLILGGSTQSTDLETSPGCYNPESAGGTTDAFIVGFNLTNLQMCYCTYIGGSTPSTASEAILSCVFDGVNVVAAGDTSSNEFPTTSGAYRRSRYSAVGADGVILGLDIRPVSVPDDPQNLIAKPDDGMVELEWDASTSENFVVIDYRIYRGDASGEETVLAEIPRMTSYVDDGLTNGRWYYYQVSALNSMGEGPLSNEVRTRPVGTPTQPLNLTGASGNGTVLLSWEPPASDAGSDILGYIVQRGITTSLEPISTLGNVTTYLDTEAVLGEIYYYGVLAFNSKGTGSASSLVRVRVTDRPSMPRDFAVVPGDGKADLSWGQPVSSGGTILLGYKIYRGESPEDLSLLATLGPLALSFEDTNLENGHFYYYQMISFTDVGESPPTLLLEAVPFTLPSAPMNLRAQAGDGNITLDWDPPESDGGRRVLRYIVLRGETPTELVQLATLGNVTSFNNTGLTNGVTYHYAVIAVNEAGEGPRSSLASGRPMGLPSAPTDLAGESTPEGILLTWRAPVNKGGADTLTYNVNRGPDRDDLTLRTSLMDEVSFLDTDVTHGARYFYMVVAANEMGEGQPSAVLDIDSRGVPGTVQDIVFRPTDGRVELSWKAPLSDGGSPITGYVVQRGLFETALQEIARVGSVLNYTDEAVENGKRYFYAVLALNAIGPGPLSTPSPATPLGVPRAPGVLKAGIEGSAVVLTWAAPTEGGRAAVTGYIVLRGLDPAGLTEFAEVGPVLMYTDFTVEMGKTYYYLVVANSTSGRGEAPTAPVKVKLEEKKEDGPGVGSGMALVAMMASAAAMLIWTRRKRFY